MTVTRYLLIIYVAVVVLIPIDVYIRHLWQVHAESHKPSALECEAFRPLELDPFHHA